MAENLLTRIHTEIRERLEMSRAAMLESERLEAALAALDHNGAGPPAPADGRRGRSSSRTPSSPPRRARAPRGANRAAVLAAIEQHPDATPAEIRAASAVEGNTLYGVLRTLVERGEVQRRELEGGQFGYRLPVASENRLLDEADATEPPPPPASAPADA